LPFWVTFCDVVASKILTGRMPKVLQTIELVPIGIQGELKPAMLLGEEMLNPATDDIFAKLVELKNKASEFKRPAIKTILNSGAYGLFAEVLQDFTDKREHVKIDGAKKRKRMPVHVHCSGASRTSFDNRTIYEERGTFPFEEPRNFFAPYGCLVPAGCRLLLAMLERAGLDREIDYSACDTDAMIFARPEHSVDVETGEIFEE